ncbi:flagellar basal body rod protein FlgB [Meridianimarinicoccus sp. RP-17]
MTAIRDHLGIHADALVLRERRGMVLASNVANAATPHFKARDFDFAAELARATGGAELTSTHARHIPVGQASGPGGLGYRQPVNPSLDGNTVELAVEQMAFSENAVRHQTSLTLLNRKISGLQRAIRGE